MNDTHTASNDHGILAHGNLCSLFQQTSSRYGDSPAYRIHGGREISWAEAQRRVELIARGLHDLGVRPDHVVAMLMPNVPEFHLVDLAILHLGAVPFSLYATDPPEKMVAQLQFCDVGVLVVDEEHGDIGRELADSCPKLEKLITTGRAGEAYMGLSTLENLGAESGYDFDTGWRAVPEDASACILFTSGTTGEPKAVQLPHRAILASLAHYGEVAPVTPQGRVMSYLPAAHIADRFASHYPAMAFGHTITCVPDHATLFGDIRAVRPTHFFTVPRVLEKLMEACVERVRASRELSAQFESRVRCIENGASIETYRATTDEFQTIREEVGLDAAEWLTVGSAPSAKGALICLGAVGIPFADIWGMSEIIVCSMNPPGGIRVGSIGQAFSRVELKVGADRELYARGPNMFTGYRNDPERTAATLVDGWIQTGDLAEIDADGYVWIVGRKKDIMINSAGKNLTPLHIEGAVQVESPLIDYVAAVGDGRRYVTAIIALDRDRVREFARGAGLNAEYSELVRHQMVRDEIANAVERGNRKLSRVEQVREWRVVEEEWVTGGELVTGSMKLMRSRVVSKYGDLVDGMYGE